MTMRTLGFFASAAVAGRANASSARSGRIASRYMSASESRCVKQLGLLGERERAADMVVLGGELLLRAQLADARQRLFAGVLLHERERAGQVAAGDAAECRPVLLRQARDR